jgi:hypothetical protein
MINEGGHSHPVLWLVIGHHAKHHAEVAVQIDRSARGLSTILNGLDVLGEVRRMGSIDHSPLASHTKRPNIDPEQIKNMHVVQFGALKAGRP